MTYLLKRDLNGPRWIGLSEALAHVRSVVGDDTELAKSELRSALSNDVISARFGPDVDPARPDKALYWGDSSSADVVPPRFWSHTLLFDVGLGFVTEQDMTAELGDDDTKPIRHRTLYIDRHRLLEVWPKPDFVREAISTETKVDAGEKRRAPTATFEKIREVAMAVYRNAENSPPNIEEAYIQVRKLLSAEGKKAPRQRVRQVLAAPEFASRRLPVGARKRS